MVANEDEFIVPNLMLTLNIPGNIALTFKILSFVIPLPNPDAPDTYLAPHEILVNLDAQHNRWSLSLIQLEQIGFLGPINLQIHQSINTHISLLIISANVRLSNLMDDPNGLASGIKLTFSVINFLG